jgi:hypothetical protein
VSGSSVSGALVLGDGTVVLAAVVVLVVLAVVLAVVDGAAVDVVAIEVVGTIVVVVVVMVVVVMVVVVMVVGTTVEVVAWVTEVTSLSAGGVPSVRTTVQPDPITRIAVRLATERRTDTAVHATGHPSSGGGGHGVTLSP